MGKNKFENFIFSFMVCFLMVLGMTTYNTFLRLEEGSSLIQALLPSTFLMIFVVALTIEWFLVSPLVKKVVGKLTNERTAFIKRVMLISALMVLFMCAAMSLVATLFEGYQGPFISAYANAFILNVAFALPLQFILAGPVARLTFFKLFPMPQQLIPKELIK